MTVNASLDAAPTRRAACIGHSHTEPVAAASAKAGVEIDVINFWSTPGAFAPPGEPRRLSDEVRARLLAPVFSLIGGAIHQDIGLVIHPRPFDFVLPSRADLPVAPEAEIIPFAAVLEAMTVLAQRDLSILSEVRQAVDGAMFHMESPPTYRDERLPQDDPGFYMFFGKDAAFSPAALRMKLWRLHSSIVEEHCRKIGVSFIPHPAEAAGADGFLLEPFHGTPAHANARYGELLLRQILSLIPRSSAVRPPASCVPKVHAIDQDGPNQENDMSDVQIKDCLMEQQKRLRAQDAAQQGDFERAVALASEALAQAPDGDLASRVIGWRMEAFAARRHRVGREHWPAPFADPFPGVAGIPCIDAAGLTGEILGGAIQHHGSLRVNGLISETVAERMRDGIDRAFAARDRVRAGADAEPGWYDAVPGDRFAKDRFFGEGHGALWAADCPVMFEETVRVLKESGVVGHIESYLAEPPCLSVMKTTLRRVAPMRSGDWHQDGRFLGREVRSVNVWLSLSHCGVDASGMDVLGGRLPYVMQTGTHGAALDWTVGNGLVDVLAEGGTAVITPEFAPGDALLFDELMLHRTCVKPGMTKDRWAIESWFFAPTGYPMPQGPLLV